MFTLPIKRIRLAAALIASIAAAHTFTGPVWAAADPSATSITTYNIQLTVDDVQQVMDRISQLPGYQSGMNYTSPAFEGAQASASITRRVPAGDYQTIKTRLRALGEMTGESETRESKSRQLSDLKAQLAAKDEEKSRLLAMMAQTGKLDTLVKVESRLNTVADESDSLNAQIRDINAQIGQPFVNIQLVSRVYAPPVQPDQPLGTRMANSFKLSVNGTVEFMQTLLVFAVIAAIPLLACAIIVVPVIMLYRFIKRRRIRGRSQ